MQAMNAVVGESRRVARVIAAAVLMTAAGVSYASADETRVVAKVPFDFIVGDTKLPAGTYRVSTVTDVPDVVKIESADGKRTIVTLTQAASSNEDIDQPMLVFDKFDGQYFLKRIAADGRDQQEIELTPAKMEQEIAATEGGSR
jgi:hypothetical protein